MIQINKHLKAPRVSVSTYVALRPEADGTLTTEAVRRARWNVHRNGRVVVSIYGLREFQGEAAALIGRIITDAQAAEVFIQVSGSGTVAARLREYVHEAAAEYAQAVAR